MSEDNDEVKDKSEQTLEEKVVPEDPTRRSFIRAAVGTGVTAAALTGGGLTLVQLRKRDGEPGLRQQDGPDDPPRPDSWAEIDLRINGQSRHLRLPHHRTLLLALREDLGLTGTKKGCNLGQCGSCTVLMDGLPVYSCFVLAADAAGKEILTIEGLEQNGKLHPVQQGFIDKMGSQCGACTTGMIMSGVALLEQNPNPSHDEIMFGLSGVLCRCGNYPNEIAGVQAAVSNTNPTDSSQRAEIPRGSGYNPTFPGMPPTASADSSLVPDSSKLTRLNSTIPSIDAYHKATGRARYTGDIGFHADDPFQKPLFAKVIRSPHPHAEIESIDDTEAQKLPGYKGMVTYRDVPNYRAKQSERTPPSKDRYFMNGKARYVGDAIAAVAADDQYAAQQALNLVKVNFRKLTAYPDAEYNLAHSIAEIHEGGTVAGFGGVQPANKPTVEFKRGNIEEGFKQSDTIIEESYTTQLQCHVPIEMHVCTAWWRNDQLTVWDSQQSIHNAKEVIANALAIPHENVRFICEYLGGGFGGKCTDTDGKTLYQAIAALLSRKTGRPVRLEYTLKEEMFAEDTRNPFVFHLKTGVKNDGTIMAMEVKAVQRTGGYASAGPAVVAVAGEGIIDTYKTPHYWFHGYSVYTNSPVGGEMRGFGHPQAVFARESHMDDIAAAIGMNPLDFRLKNSLHTGDKIELAVASDVPLQNIAAEECVRRGADAIGWNRWEPPSKKQGRIRRGLGMRFSQEHSGRNASDGIIWRDKNGRIHVPLGIGNIGTLAHTGIALIVAEALGVPVSQLDVTWADTSDTAWDFVTDASRSVHCHGKAMYNAALDLKRKMRGGAKTQNELTPYFDPQQDINPLLDESTGQVTKQPPPKLHAHTEAMARRLMAEGATVGLGYYIWNPGVQTWGASFAEVEVDMETGQVTVLKLVGVHDIGRVIYKTGAEAQVHGGGVMGLGYAMTEDLIIDPNNGIPVNQSLYEYRPPTILDVPQMVPILVEAPAAAGPFGAKGLGENPIYDAPAAVANAIFNATGLRIGEIPFTWHRVYEALRRAGKLNRDLQH